MFSYFRKKRRQRKCAHEWHIVSEYDTPVEGYSFTEICDIYCPKCEKERMKVELRVANKLVKQCSLRAEYHDAYSDLWNSNLL